MERPFFTVVMPAYGVEKYLKKAVDSIRNQTFEDWELIIVEDGSPDRTGELADRLHVTRQAVSNLENRKTQPDIETLDAIAQVFSLDLTELLHGNRPSGWTKRRVVQIAVYGSAAVGWLLLWLFALPAAQEHSHRTYNFSMQLTVHFL